MYMSHSNFNINIYFVHINNSLNASLIQICTVLHSLSIDFNIIAISEKWAQYGQTS